MAREIPLTKGQVAIVDDGDFEYLNQWKWYAQEHPETQSFYAARKSKGKSRKAILMHRVILGCTSIERGDHVEPGRTLDNRRSNLRKATCKQNNRNCRIRKDNRSGFKGVSLEKSQRWVVRIRIDSIRGTKLKIVGHYDDKEQAARAYDRAALCHHGEFAKTNFPREEYVNG